MRIECVLPVEDGQSLGVSLFTHAKDGRVHGLAVGEAAVHIFWGGDDKEVGVDLVANFAWEVEEAYGLTGCHCGGGADWCRYIERGRPTFWFSSGTQGLVQARVMSSRHDHGME